MLKEKLNIRNIWAKIVPKVRTHEQKQIRKSIYEDLFYDIRSDGNDLGSQVITGDENWIFECDPENRRQSKQWGRTTKARMSPLEEANFDRFLRYPVVLKGLTLQD